MGRMSPQLWKKGLLMRSAGAQLSLYHNICHEKIGCELGQIIIIHYSRLTVSQQIYAQSGL